MRKRKNLCLPAAFLAAACLLSACELIPEEPLAETAAVIERFEHEAYETAECCRADIEKIEQIYVKYVPVRSESLSFTVPGISYEESFVSVGDTVRQGDLLAELRIGSLEEDRDAAARELAGYELEKAQTAEDLDLALRMQALKGASLTPEEQQAAIDSINAAYSRTLQRIDDQIYITGLRIAAYETEIEARRIYAPFDGVITYRYEPKPSDISEPYKKIFTLVDSSHSVFSSETEFSSYFKEGDVYTVIARNTEYPCEVRSAEALGIEAAEDSEIVYFELLTPAFDLEDDTLGKFSIVLDHREDVLAVPIHAVSEINGRTVVYYPDDYGMKCYREVETGIDDGHFVEIRSGLSEGDVVIVE